MLSYDCIEIQDLYVLSLLKDMINQVRMTYNC